MNSMNELLNSDLIDLKIAERHAEAAAWRRARAVSVPTKTERGWTFSAVLQHLPSLGNGRPAPTKAI